MIEHVFKKLYDTLYDEPTPINKYVWVVSSSLGVQGVYATEKAAMSHVADDLSNHWVQRFPVWE